MLTDLHSKILSLLQPAPAQSLVKYCLKYCTHHKWIPIRRCNLSLRHSHSHKTTRNWRKLLFSIWTTACKHLVVKGNWVWEADGLSKSLKLRWRGSNLLKPNIPKEKPRYLWGDKEYHHSHDLPSRGSPKHPVETEAKSYRLALDALVPELSPQVNINILNFSKVSITCLQQLCLVMKIWLWKDSDKRKYYYTNYTNNYYYSTITLGARQTLNYCLLNWPEKEEKLTFNTFWLSKMTLPVSIYLISFNPQNNPEQVLIILILYIRREVQKKLSYLHGYLAIKRKELWFINSISKLYGYWNTWVLVLTMPNCLQLKLSPFLSLDFKFLP